MNAVLKKLKGPLKLDIGCGKNKQADHVGVDQYPMDGVDVVTDLRKAWPWKSGTVESVHCSHFLEHLTNLNGKWERVHFFNELYRVLQTEGKCLLILPHWSSNRYYGDPTHAEPFSEMGFYYLDPAWREKEAPHTDKRWNKSGYECHFACSWGYGMHPGILARNSEYQQFAMQWYKEACTDIHATLVKK